MKQKVCKRPPDLGISSSVSFTDECSVEEMFLNVSNMSFNCELIVLHRVSIRYKTTCLPRDVCRTGTTVPGQMNEYVELPVGHKGQTDTSSSQPVCCCSIEFPSIYAFCRLGMLDWVAWLLIVWMYHSRLIICVDMIVSDWWTVWDLYFGPNHF